MYVCWNRGALHKVTAFDYDDRQRQRTTGCRRSVVVDSPPPPLELYLTTSELFFGQEQWGILPNCCLVVVSCNFL